MRPDGAPSGDGPRPDEVGGPGEAGPSRDPERLATVAAQVRAGRYRIDTLDVADAVLRRWSMRDIVDDFEDRQSNEGSSTSDSSD